MNVEELLERFKARQDADLGQGATEQEIEEAERALGVRFPQEYAEFLHRAGWLDWGYGPIFGLGRGIPPNMHLVKKTMQERHLCHPNIPIYLLPIMNDGCGNHYCLFVEGPNKNKVAFWDHEHEDEEKQIPAVRGLGFVDWLSRYESDKPDD